MYQSAEFSMLGYRSLVAKFLDANYRFVILTKKFDERVVIFRHDIDFSIQAARDLGT